MNNNTYTTRFRLILYQWSQYGNIGSQFQFDVYDEVDLSGNSLKDSLVDRPGQKELDQIISEEKNRLKIKAEDYKERLDKLGKLPYSSHSLPPKVDLSVVDTSHPYIGKFFEDKHSYYVEPGKSINWKMLDPTTDYKKINEPHNLYLKKKLSSIETLFTKDWSLHDLISSGEVVEADITEAVKNIGSYTVSIDGIDLNISFTLDLDTLRSIFGSGPGYPYITENSVVDFYVDFVGTESFDTNLYIGEYKGPATKDDLEKLKNAVDTNKDLGPYTYTRRFVGVVTGVDYNIQPGEVPVCTIKCRSYSAYLDRLNTVKDQALMTFFEHNKLDMQLPGLNVFQDILNSKTVDEILAYVLESLYLSNAKPDKDGKVYFTKIFDPKNKLAATTLPENVEEAVNILSGDGRISEIKGLLFTTKNSNLYFGKVGLSFYRRGWILFKDIEELFFENNHNFAAPYWVTYLYFKVREKYRSDIVELLEKAKKELNELMGVRIAGTLEVSETGETVPLVKKESPQDLQKKIKNKQDTIDRLNQILKKHNYIVAYQEGDTATIRAYVLQVKSAFTPFYSVLSTGREILDSLFELTHIFVFEDEPGTIVLRFPRFNLIDLKNGLPTDTFVINREDILNYSWSRNDFSLFSRQDYTPIMPLTSGDIMRWCWPYTDSQILFKYGSHLAPKTTNPNATMFYMNYIAHFSAVSLAYKNASTRTISLTVVNKGQRYCLGRTYFIPDPFVNLTEEKLTWTGWVAMLHSMTYNYSVGTVPTIDLKFSFARRVMFTKT